MSTCRLPYSVGLCACLALSLASCSRLEFSFVGCLIQLASWPFNKALILYIRVTQCIVNSILAMDKLC